MLIAAVLLQPGKTDAGALFTSNVSSSAFAPRGTATVLSKVTITAATTFMLSALFLAMPAVTGNVSVLGSNPEIENAIITVADQVHISSEIFEALQSKQEQTQKNIVASAYAQTTGAPTLFNKKYFEKLLALNGTIGAKSLIKKYVDDTVTIPFELGNIDIDTETDYNNLTHN